MVGQRFMQAASDMLLGWPTADYAIATAPWYENVARNRDHGQDRAEVLRTSLRPRPGARTCAFGESRGYRGLGSGSGAETAAQFPGLTAAGINEDGDPRKPGQKTAAQS